MECMCTKRKQILGFGVDLFSFEDAMQYVHNCLKENKGLHIVTINPEMISLAGKDKEFANIINNADLVIPDGVGIKLALRIKGTNQENIPGIEFAKKLLSLSSLEGFSVGLLGAKENVIQKAADKLREEYKDINITYIRNGYFDENQLPVIVKEIAAVAPRVFLVAMGAPKQEVLINKLKQLLPETVFIGVGGSFDVWSGEVKRAPEIYQRLCLEWLYRAIKEPARFKRIFPALPLFLIQVIIETLHENLVKQK